MNRELERVCALAAFYTRMMVVNMKQIEKRPDMIVRMRTQFLRKNKIDSENLNSVEKVCLLDNELPEETSEIIGDIVMKTRESIDWNIDLTNVVLDRFDECVITETALGKSKQSAMLECISKLMEIAQRGYK